MNCLNCDTYFTGHFCPFCGQKSQTRRLTVLSVLHDFYGAFFDSDRGFLRTAIDLSRQPGETIRDYMDGKRKRYLPAAKYTLFLVVVFTINISFIESHFGFFETITHSVSEWNINFKEKNVNVRLTDSDKEPATSSSAKKKNSENFHLNFDLMGRKIDKDISRAELLNFLEYLLPRYHASLFDSLKFLIILWIPIIAFFSYVFFFFQKYNFAEHITINSFIFAHLLLIATLLSPAYWLFPSMTGTTILCTIISCGFYLVFSFLRIFNSGNWRLVKIVSVLSLGAVTYITIVATSLSLLALWIAFNNIDYL